jgi:hypothetical protein
MSRGHGKVERAILEALRCERGRRGRFCLEATAERLALYVRSGPCLLETVGDDARIEGHPRHVPTRSEIESVRRALRNLRKQGLVLPGHRLNCTIYERPGKKRTMS